MLFSRPLACFFSNISCQPAAETDRDRPIRSKSDGERESPSQIYLWPLYWFQLTAFPYHFTPPPPLVSHCKMALTVLIFDLLPIRLVCDQIAGSQSG